MFTTQLTQPFVHGATELEQTARGLRPHRLPSAVRTRYPDRQLMLMESQASGVRVVFETKARQIVLEIHALRTAYKGMRRARGSVDVTVDGDMHSTHILLAGDICELDFVTGTQAVSPGVPERIDVANLPVGEKVIEFWLPHNEQVDLIALHTDAPVNPVVERRPVWLHHGSSVSQGSNATQPTGIWPVVAARRSNVQLHNLGFGGSALVDPFVARLMRDTAADYISVKLGLNTVNLDAMRFRSFVPAVHGFLDVIRDGHAVTPLVLISPIFCGIHEDTPGPGAVDPDTIFTDSVKFIATGNAQETIQGKLTLQVIRPALEQIVRERGDKNLYYLDGLKLFGATDALSQPIPDGIHPDSATHTLIGDRFARYAFGSGGFFAGRAPQPS